MSIMASLVRNILDTVFRLQNELDLFDFRNVLLNDLVSVFYGLPRIISEIRILVSPGDTRLLAEAIVNTLHLYKYKDKIIDAIEKQGSVAVNPVTMPLTYIVVARDEYLSKILSSSRNIKVSGYIFKIPSLEAYISYLIKLNQYPYTVDGITLLLIWSTSIDKEKVLEYGLKPGTLCNLISDVLNEVEVFYELRKIVEKAYSIFCR